MRKEEPDTTTDEQLNHYTPANVVTEPDELAVAIREQLYPTLGFDDSEWAEVVPDVRAGWCYQASEAYYHAIDPTGWDRISPMQVSIDVAHPNFIGEVSHWFLHHDEGAIIDLTAEQFHTMSIEIPYEDATARGFVPPSPSSQTETLLDALPDTVIENPEHQ